MFTHTHTHTHTHSEAYYNQGKGWLFAELNLTIFNSFINIIAIDTWNIIRVKFIDIKVSRKVNEMVGKSD